MAALHAWRQILLTGTAINRRFSVLKALELIRITNPFKTGFIANT